MDSHLFTLIHGWWLWGSIGGAHNESICLSFLQMFGIDSKSYLTSISTIMPCMGPCSCRGVYSNNTHISSKHTCSHVWWNHENPSLFSSLAEVDLPSLVDDFHLEIEVTLDWKAFVFALIRSSYLSFNDPLSMVYEFL